MNAAPISATANVGNDSRDNNGDDGRRQCEERRYNNQLDERHKRGVTRGDSVMRSRGAGQMGGGGIRRGYATTNWGTRGTRGA
jgi:hypothetical protein